MCLPLLVLALSSAGGLTRYVRAAMIDALRMDCIRTARAKGLREKVVIYTHAFRNALIPMITILTGWFVGVFGGSVVIETIFLWNGIGKVLVDSLRQQDFSVVLAMQMFYVVLTLAGELADGFRVLLGRSQSEAELRGSRMRGRFGSLRKAILIDIRITHRRRWRRQLKLHCGQFCGISREILLRWQDWEYFCLFC